MFQYLRLTTLAAPGIRLQSGVSKVYWSKAFNDNYSNINFLALEENANTRQSYFAVDMHKAIVEARTAEGFTPYDNPNIFRIIKFLASTFFFFVFSQCFRHVKLAFNVTIPQIIRFYCTFNFNLTSRFLKWKTHTFVFTGIRITEFSVGYASIFFRNCI